MHDYSKLPFLQEIYLRPILHAFFQPFVADAHKARALLDFSSKFHMTPPYWMKLLLILQDFNVSLETKKAWQTLAMSQFYSPLYGDKQDKHIKWDGITEVLMACQLYDTYPHGIMALEEALTFPHQHLEGVLEAFDALSAKPMSKELFAKYEKSLEIYNILKLAKFDAEWYKALEAIEDEQLIILNLEYFIGKYYSCVELWKYYINFQRHRNPTKMLNIYRRFNRFFIGDLNMIEEYRYEIEKVGNAGFDVTDFWVETIEFELQRINLTSAQKLFEKAIMFMVKKDFKKHANGKAMLEHWEMFKLVRTFYSFLERSIVNSNSPNEKFKQMLEKWSEIMKKNEMKEIEKMDIEITEENEQPAATATPSQTKGIANKCNFDDEAALPQSFSYPISMIYQMLNSAKPKTLSKLFKSCKALFRFHRTPLCYQLGVNDEVKPQYFQQSLFLPITHLNSPALHRLQIVNSLDWIVETDRKALSRVIPKLNRCNAKYIHIDGQDLTLDEFKFLTTNVQKLHLCDTNVFKADGSLMSLEEITSFTVAQVNVDGLHM